jgi:hypothetical protein
MDPLAQLKTIHLPEQINNYPFAYGWWILLFTVIVICMLTLRKYLRHRKNCHAKRQAMNSLKENNLDAEQLISLLKWAALHYFPRQQVASLSGDKLQNFLTSCLPAKQQEAFINLLQPALAKRYQRDEQQNTDELSGAVMLWLKNALPPKKQAKLKVTVEESVKQDHTKLAGVNS